MLDKILRNTAKRIPSEVGIYYATDQITYSQLDQDVDNLASGFLELGLAPQEKVGVILGNSPDIIRSYFAVLRAGGVVVPLNPLFKGEELKYFINDSQIKYVITFHNHLPLIASIKNEVPSLQRIIVVGGVKDEFVIPYEDLLHKNSSPVDLDITEDALAAIQYTSGTSGKPKGAQLTQGNLMFCLEASITRTGMTQEDNSLCILPLFHIFSQFVNMLMPIYLGGKVTILPQFVPGLTLEEIDAKKISFLTAVPAMLLALLGVLQQNNTFDLSSLRLIISGGAPLPLEVYNRVRDRFGVPVIEGSGPTEAVTFVGRPDADKSGTVGTPLDGVEAKIVGADDQPLPVGEIGEICVKGPNVMKGYNNMPEETAEVLKNGWFYTGDLGKMDEDGFVYIVDRKKDMIIVGGMNVYPREIEECLYKHPSVLEAAVIGVKDKDRDEVPKAYIALKPGTEAEPKDIILFCRKHLANFKCPRHVSIVEKLPRSATGKIDKKLIIAAESA